MLSLLRRSIVDERIRLLCSTVLGAEADALPKRDMYFLALNRLQLHPVPASTEGVVELTFDLDPVTTTFVKHMMQTHHLPDNVEFDALERKTIVRSIAGALDILDKFEPHAVQVLRALVGRIVFARSATSAGGSVGDSLGQVWLSPLSNWTPLKYAECLWHESTHQALFLAEMINPIFDVGCQRNEMPQITSAIRRTKRPLDLSFHAACVGAALVDFYRRLGHEEHADALVAPLSVTLRELRAHKRWLTEQGQQLLIELLETPGVTASKEAVAGPAEGLPAYEAGS